MPTHRSLADDVRSRTPQELRDLVVARPDLLHPGRSDLTGLAARAATRSSVQRAVDALPADALRVLDALVASSGELAGAAARLAVEVDAITDFADDLWTRALVWRNGDRLTATREVAQLLAEVDLDQAPFHHPVVGTPGGGQKAADAHAGHAALDLVWQVEALAEHWEAAPPRVMSKGGVSVRDHKGLAGHLDTTIEHSAFIAELAHAAGLLAPDAEIDPTWLPTPAYDDWLQEPPASRWVALARAWWTMLRAPSLVASRDPGGSVVNLLGDASVWPMMRQRRHDVLSVLLDLPAEVAVSVDDVDVLLRWHRPLRLPPGVPTRADVVVQEAEWLGLVADGRLSSVGRALAVDRLDDSVAAPLLPALLDHILVQADLTAIAPGPLTDDLRRLMHTVADVESRGGATVFRITDRSMNRALDAGHSAAGLREQLRCASLNPLPQSLEYLIDDAARRHGVTRVGAASSYVRSDDESLLNALVADTAAEPLQLLRIAPTVLVSRLPAARLLNLLREIGYSTLAEDASGSVAVIGGEPARAPSPRPSASITRTTVDESAAEQFVEKLLQASGTEAPATGDPAVTVDVLLDAAATGVPVRVGYVDTSGNIRRITMRPRSVDAGRVTGTVGENVRTISVHRITAVTPA